MAASVPAHIRRRPGIRPQVEHGMDARRAGLHVARSRSSAAIATTRSRSDCSTPSRKISFCRFSHDEVVYGKGSLLAKMPGDDWQKFANLRLLYGFMFGHPGKKHLFMGDEFGQRSEWNHEASLDWHLLDNPMHAGLKRWVRDLNTAVSRPTRILRTGFRRGRLRVGGLHGLSAERPHFPAARPQGGRRSAFCLQFHARGTNELSRRRAFRQPFGKKS